MNRLILAFILAVCSLAASAQKLYFVYLQTESDQPFYIKMNEKVYSSSASGYLILPKLRDTTYQLTLGFAQNKWPEQQYTITIARKDHGFLVKHFGEKGWGLFNLQTLEIIQPAAGKTTATGTAGNGVSGFTEILSKAADDPSLKEIPAKPPVETKKAEVTTADTKPAAEVVITPRDNKPADAPAIPDSKPTTATTKQEEAITKPVVEKAVVAEQPKTEPAATTTAGTTNPVAVKEEQKPEIKAEVKNTGAPAEEMKTTAGNTEAPQEEYKMSQVTRRSESSTTEGFGLVYLDRFADGTTDTVRLLIPNPKPAVATIKEEPREEKKMLDIPVEITKVEEKPATEAPAAATPPAAETKIAETKPAEKVHCPEVAAEADFFKLRKAMAAAESDDEMILEAKKYFKQKCFTTAQVKNLGTLFLTDQGKYNFYDAAYPFAADMANYSTLQAELKDEYYINRFKAMLRN